MRPMTITWVYEPHDSPMFHLGRDRRFVEEVGNRAGLAIPLLEGPLRDVAPTEGFILLNSFRATDSLMECASAGRHDLAERVIAIDASRSRIFENTLEPWSMAGAVDATSHAQWSQPGRSAGTPGLYGLRRIAPEIGSILEGDGSARYAYLVDPARELPHLLADYLAALHRSRAGTDSVLAPAAQDEQQR
jgi:hypothetical protein